MKKEIKDRWVQLLESGEYNLGKGRLYNYATDCHCVIGVLVELALEDGVDLQVTRYGNFAKIGTVGEVGTKVVFDPKFYQWSGTTQSRLDSVAARNDNVSPNSAIAYIKEVM